MMLQKLRQAHTTLERTALRAGRALPCLVLMALSAGCAASSHRPPPPPAPRASDWRDQVPPAGSPAPVTYPLAEHDRLDNGMNVYVVRRPAGVLTLSLVVRCDPPEPGRTGLAALTTRMLTEGTVDHPGLALAEAAESLGSTLASDAGRDSLTVGLTTLRSDASRALALLAEVVQRPGFDPRVVARVRSEWIDGLLAERQEPSRIASLVGLRAQLGDIHGAPVGGAVEDVRQLEAADLRTYHVHAFVPNSSALVVVGDVALDDIRSDVAHLFGSWTGAPVLEAAPPPVPEAPARTRVLVVDRPGAVQTALFVAQPLPKRGMPGHEARQVINSIVGGLFTSRINTNLREKHAYTYGARSVAVATRYWGAWIATTSVKTDVTAPALKQLVSELKGVQDPARGRPIADDELARAKADLVAALGAHLERIEAVESDTQALFTYGLPPDYFSGYPERVAAVTLQSAAEQARTTLVPDRLTVVAVGDQARITAALTQHGFDWVPAPEALWR
ncbi:MAG: insulinase family protein [Polyangiaceae bacterium]|nr:insulinase family protein [Polyangiaceae bacterium]